VGGLPRHVERAGHREGQDTEPNAGEHRDPRDAVGLEDLRSDGGGDPTEDETETKGRDGQPPAHGRPGQPSPALTGKQISSFSPPARIAPYVASAAPTVAAPMPAQSTPARSELAARSSSTSARAVAPASTTSDTSRGKYPASDTPIVRDPGRAPELDDLTVENIAVNPYDPGDPLSGCDPNVCSGNALLMLSGFDPNHVRLNRFRFRALAGRGAHTGLRGVIDATDGVIEARFGVLYGAQDDWQQHFTGVRIGAPGVALR